MDIGTGRIPSTNAVLRMWQLNLAANTTTSDLRGSDLSATDLSSVPVETGRVKLSGVQDHADIAQVAGGMDGAKRP